MKKISLILPVYNEAHTLKHLYEQVVAVYEKIKDTYSYEILFVDDGSSDDSWKIIDEISRKDKQVIGIRFTKNFGKETALLAGVREAKGDIIITMDTDGQHPVNHILDFVKQWESGYQIVFGIRKHVGRNVLRKIASNIFNRSMRGLSKLAFEGKITDYILMDRKVADIMCSRNGSIVLWRGTLLSLGFEYGKVLFDELKRIHGTSQWNIIKLYDLAIKSMTSFSFAPLRFLGLLGGGIIFLSSLTLIGMFVSRFLLDNRWNITNTAFLVVFSLFLSGITLTALGILAIYIANINQHVQGHPPYIIRERSDDETK